jgi:hypothetical protein
MEKKLSSPKKSKGQILVMYAIMLLVLVAIMGLAIDVGYVYVSYARLRRAVDAAALNASNQIKEGYSYNDLVRSATEFLLLNDVHNLHDVKVNSCDNTLSMCAADPTRQRKLVSVSASSNVPTFFMSVLGFDTLEISASAESEAATVDVVLVIDTSESQTRAAGSGAPLSDPYLCNELDNCQPFKQIKTAALAFVDELYFPYDRVGVVTFDRHATVVLPLSNTEVDVVAAIESLKVFEAEPCPYLFGEPEGLASEGSICRAYENGANDFRADDPPLPHVNWPKYPTIADVSAWPFVGMDCPQAILGQPELVHNCYSTNVGEGLLYAGVMLADPLQTRDESLWVVIMLTDGTANIGYGSPTLEYCPDANVLTLCQDTRADGTLDVDSRHDALTQPTLYDPDDYTRDMADYLYGQEVYLFSIGMGPYATDPGDKYYEAATALMNYVVAPVDANNYQAPARGIYYAAPGGDELRRIFLQIANNIATRITR